MLAIANVFQPLIDVFESVLKFFHNSLGIEWGWAIILLTVCVRAVLIPLTLKQIKSMVRMQQLAPQMKAIQQKYKQDKQRQQQEIMKFYRENNVNPLSSCLPLVLQLPVFVALYYMLRESLRKDICPQVQAAFHAAGHHGTTACGTGHGASFLFIPDLTNKATGITLVVLIILYVGSQLSSSVLMSAATMDPTQRKIMMFMPVIFVLFVIRFPAGLLVYWITTNLWTIGQQYVVKKRIGPIQAANAAAAAVAEDEAKARGSGGGPSARGDKELEPAGNGSGSGSGTGGGLGAMLRERMRAVQDREKVTSGSSGRSSRSEGGRGRAGGRAAGKSSGGGGGKSATSGNGSSARSGPPPKPPRKKKKRSGRRR